MNPDTPPQGADTTLAPPAPAPADTSATAGTLSPDQIRAMPFEEYANLSATEPTPDPTQVHQMSLLQKIGHWVTTTGSDQGLAHDSGSTPEQRAQHVKNIGTETGRSLMQLRDNVSNFPVASKMTPEQMQARVAGQEANRDQVFGPKTDDSVAHFLGGSIAVTAAAVPFLAAGAPAGVAFGIGMAAQANPYENSITQVMAQADKLPPVFRDAVQFVGKALMENKTDSPAYAQNKRLVANIVGNVMFDALFAIPAKLKAAYTTMTTEGTSAAVKEEAAKVIQEGQAAIADAVQNPHPTGPVTVVNNADGTATTAINPHPVPQGLEGVTHNPDGSVTVKGFRGGENPNAPSPIGGRSFSPDQSIAEGYATQGGRAKTPGTVVQQDITMGNPLVLGPMHSDPLFTKMDLPEIIQYAKDQGHDGIIISQGHGGKPEFIALDGVDQVKGPRMTPEEASTQAQMTNHAAEITLPAQDASIREQIAFHVQEAKRLFESGTPEDIARLAEGSHINLGLSSGTKEIHAQIEAISSQYNDILNATKGRPGVKVVDVLKQVERIRAETSDPALLRGLMEHYAHLTGNRAIRLAGEDMLLSKGKDMAVLAEMLDARPNDVALWTAAEAKYTDYLGTVEALAGIDSEYGRALRLLQERPKITGTGKVAATEKAAAAAAEPKPMKGTPTPAGADKVAGMDRRELKTAMQMFKMAKGKPRNIFAIVQGMKVYRNTGMTSAALEIFKNGLLSGPRTFESIVVGGLAINSMEAAARVIGGLATGDLATAREGADLMFGYLANTREGYAAALEAFDKGYSQINPQPIHIAIDNAAGSLIRVPGKIAGAADEFGRVIAYRSYVRAQALREAREAGLTGAAKIGHVDQALRAAFDPATGIATLPEGLQFAERGTLSAPLRDGTFGKGLGKLVNEHSALQLILPFMRAAGNGMDQAWQMLPYLGSFQPEVKAALEAGGRDAAVAKARMTIGAGAVGFAITAALSGRLTGYGPRDKAARAVWLTQNRPYSYDQTGNHDWVDYSRMDPVNTILGMAADGVDVFVAKKNQGSQTDGADITGMLLQAAYNSTLNRSYNQGIQRFMDAFAQGKALDWAQGLASQFVVPQGIAATNTDYTVRQPKGLVEKMSARVPVLSESVPAAYDPFGQYQYTPGALTRGFTGYLERNISPYPERHMGVNTVAQEFANLGGGHTPFPRTTPNGQIDFASSIYKKEDGLTPYDYANKVLREGADGMPPLYTALMHQIESPEYQELSDGSLDYPGGAKFMVLTKVVDAYYRLAEAKMRQAYPKLHQDLLTATVTKKSALVPAGSQRNAILDILRP